MGKIKAEDKQKVVPVTFRMREDWLEKLTAYCKYLNPESPSSPGYVLTESFKQVIERDADFALFLESYTQEGNAKSALKAHWKRIGNDAEVMRGAQSKNGH